MLLTCITCITSLTRTRRRTVLTRLTCPSPSGPRIGSLRGLTARTWCGTLAVAKLEGGEQMSKQPKFPTGSKRGAKREPEGRSHSRVPAGYIRRDQITAQIVELASGVAL